MELYNDMIQTHALGYSDFMYGGVDLAQYFNGFTVSRSVMSPVAVEELTIPGRDGALLNGYRHEPLVITVSGALNGHDRELVEAIRQRLALLLSPRAKFANTPFIPDDTTPLKKLYLGEKSSVARLSNHYIVYDAMVRGEITIDRQYGFPHVSIDFYIPDGYGYDNSYTYTTFSSEGLYEDIEVSGNFPTYPKIEVLTRTSSDLVITNTTTNVTKYIKTSNTSTGIYIDCENEVALSSLNYLPQYVVPVAFDIGSDFFPLYPFVQNKIRIAGGTVKMWYKERYA